MLTFEHISKNYRQNKVLHDISFTVEDGEITVLIGPSGCGKTTCLKMVNRLIKPSEGRILLNGADIADEDPIALRRRMGYVIQQTGLFPHMTVQENIEIIPRLEKWPEEKIKARTEEMMEMIGLPAQDYLWRYPTQLSGGQQQRIGVARAFEGDPEIILMDEPFSALDPITRGQLQEQLLDLQHRLKKTIIFVTHDMDEAIKIADKICIMDGGKILQYDTPEQILKNPADDFVRSFVGQKRIWSQPGLIKAADIMLQNPVTGFEDMTVLRAVEIMRIHKVDSLMITDDRHHLTGVLNTEMVDRADIDKTVGQVFSRKVTSVAPQDSIVDLLSILNDSGYSSLPVVEDDGRLAGLITRSSLITTLSRQFLPEKEQEAE